MPKLLSVQTKQEIKKLRQRGHSFPEISHLLKIPKSSAWRYSATVSILPQFKERWLQRRNSSKIISERAWHEARSNAEKWISQLGHTERKIIASTLYWAEGNKKDLSFTNTDPEMIAIFMDILRQEFQVKDSEFKISIRIYEDLNQKNCIEFWSKITRINLKNNVSINILPGKKIGKCPFGMCRVRVKKGGFLLKTIFAINKKVSTIISSS